MTPPTMPWHHPASRQRGLIGVLLVLFVLLIAAAAGAAIAYLIITRVDVGLALRDQPAQAVIPQTLRGTVVVSEPIGLRLTDTIVTQVPIDQWVAIPLKASISAIANLDGAVPLKLQVKLQDEIPLKQVVQLDTVVDAFLPELGSTISIPLRGEIPIDTMVPVDIDIPVDQQLPVKFSVPLKASIDQVITVPLKTTIEAAVPVDADLRVPLLNRLDAVVQMPNTPSDLVITEGELKLPLRTLRLGLIEDEGGAP